MRWVDALVNSLSSDAPFRREAAPGVLRYGLAIALAALAGILTSICGPFIERSLFIFFFAAVAASAWYAGLGPGLLTTVIAVASANSFFIPAYDRWEKGPGDLLVLSVFGILAVILSSFSESRRAARGQAEHEADQARELALRTSQLERQLTQVRLDTLRAQLNPHFLFNTLNTIAMLVRRQANAQAVHGIVGLSQMLRQVLDRRNSPEVRLGEELALVEHYLAVEQLRFGDRLGVTISVAPEVLDAWVPNLILQPLVENAVRHGIARRRDAGCIRIAGWRHEDLLRLEIRDNGPGFPDGWDTGRPAGIGLANTRERLERRYGSGHTFVAGNVAGGGASVSLAIPFRTALPT